MNAENHARQSTALIRVLTCMMFFMFAMTTDAVGSIIPSLIDEFDLSLSAASAFHYVPMISIALGGLLLGFLADRIGRKRTIVLGLVLYGIGSLLFIVGNTFGFFIVLLGMSGIGVSVFKVGALGLIGDITRSPREHTSLMNTVEGFFCRGRYCWARSSSKPYHGRHFVEISISFSRYHLWRANPCRFVGGVSLYPAKQ